MVMSTLEAFARAKGKGVLKGNVVEDLRALNTATKQWGRTSESLFCFFKVYCFSSHRKMTLFPNIPSLTYLFVF